MSFKYLRHRSISKPNSFIRRKRTQISTLKATQDVQNIGIIKAKAPSHRELIQMRLMVLLGTVSVILFCIWLFDGKHIGAPVLFWILTAALLFKISRWLVEWYHYSFMKVNERPDLKHTYSVDILTTYCKGEPFEMIKETLIAIKNIDYPHETFLCDESDDKELKFFCNRYSIHHITRKEKLNAKAGNINNALKQATGEICVILDPDHVPKEDFLERVLPYFDKPEIGFVQIVQTYSNHKENLIARGAAEQTYHFYGPIMMGMNGLGTAQAIGANCTFRRAALDSIGGHAAGLAEDLHTSMQLHAAGWKSIYVPEALTKGLVPSSLNAFFKQQLKWSRGCFELLLHSFPKLFSEFTLQQKLHYFSAPMYYLYGLVALVDILIPALALFTGIIPWSIALPDFLIHFIPLYFIAIAIRLYAQKWLIEKHEKGIHLMGGMLRTASWWIFLVGVVSTFLRIKIPYIPTPKDDKAENAWILSLPNLIAAAFCITAIVYGLSIEWNAYTLMMAGFAAMNAGILIFVSIISQQNSMDYLKSKTQRAKRKGLKEKGKKNYKPAL